jgi:hypothetical protein
MLMLMTELIGVKKKVIAKGVAGIWRVEYQCFPLKAGMAPTTLRTAMLM